jgi:hypothetical protein
MERERSGRRERRKFLETDLSLREEIVGWGKEYRERREKEDAAWRGGQGGGGQAGYGESADQR